MHWDAFNHDLVKQIRNSVVLPCVQVLDKLHWQDVWTRQLAALIGPS